MRVIGAVDIGGTKTAVGGVAEDGTVVYRSECATDPAHGFADAIERITRMLRTVEQGAAARLAGIGVACPGPLNAKTGVLGEVGTLPGWRDGDLGGELAKRFGVSVAVENDADAGALAEFARGDTNGAESFLYFTLSTGIGGGMIARGELYRGVDGSHPEYGHQVIDPSGPLCYCGAHGCWESLASGSALGAWMQMQTPDHPLYSSAEVCEMARQGDALAKSAVKRLAFYLGLGLANIATLFSPDVIVLGGGLMGSSSLFLEEAVEKMRATATQVPVEKTRVLAATLGRDTCLLGAAQAWLHRYTRIQ